MPRLPRSETGRCGQSSFPTHRHRRARALKEFIRLRDHHAAFADARRQGYLGIPCFVMDDGRICFTAEEAGLDVHPATPEACSLDGTGC